MKLLLLFLLPLTANAPTVTWTLVPAEWKEYNLCLKPCVLKHYVVDGYVWEAR